MGIAAAGAVAGAAIGGGMSAAAAKKAAAEAKKIAQMQINAQTKIHEASAADRERLSQMTRADVGIAQHNLLASENAQVNVLQSLGQPGTYGDPYQGGAITLNGVSPLGISGMGMGGGVSGNSLSETTTVAGRVKRSQYGLGDIKKDGKFKKGRKWKVEGELLNADEMANAAKNTAGFRTVSHMVAEAEQIMNRSGPAWNALNNSIVGSIYESGAAMHKQQMEQISKNLAQGGSARRIGLQMAQSMQVQENTNRVRTGELWKARAGLEEYRTQNAQNVTSFAQNWVSNSSGIRDSFTANLNQLQLHWSQTMAPQLAASTVGAQTATQEGVLKAGYAMQEANTLKLGAIQGSIGLIQGISDKAFAALAPGGALNGLFTSGETSFGKAAENQWASDSNAYGGTNYNV